MNEIKKEGRFPNDPISNTTKGAGHTLFATEFPDDFDWIQANKDSAPVNYCLAIANFKLDLYDNRANAVSFWGQSIAHAQLILTVGKNALEALKAGSGSVGTPLNECYHAMSYDVSASTKRRIIKEAIERDYLRETIASWNCRIKLIYLTGPELRTFLRQQLLFWDIAQHHNLPKYARQMEPNDPLIAEIMNDEFKQSDF